MNTRTNRAYELLHRSHVGHLGMGLVPDARHQGLGAKLLKKTLSKAWSKGLNRIGLAVRVDNVDARALYEKFGFRVEGLQVCGNRIGKEYFDLYAMALLQADRRV